MPIFNAAELWPVPLPVVAFLHAGSKVGVMALGTPHMTFGELARKQLEMEVICPNCGHPRLIDGDDPALRDRKVAGARFRCAQCGSVGLPELGRQRRWPGRLAEHARKLG